MARTTYTISAEQAAALDGIARALEFDNEHEPAEQIRVILTAIGAPTTSLADAMIAAIEASC